MIRASSGKQSLHVWPGWTGWQSFLSVDSRRGNGRWDSARAPSTPFRVVKERTQCRDVEPNIHSGAASNADPSEILFDISDLDCAKSGGARNRVIQELSYDLAVLSDGFFRKAALIPHALLKILHLSRKALGGRFKLLEMPQEAEPSGYNGLEPLFRA